MRLLVIAPHYNYFIKEQVEALSKHVEEVTVFVRYNPLVEIFSRVSLWRYASHLKNYTYERMFNLEGLPDNVSVYPIKIKYFVPDGRNPRLGGTLAKKIERIVKNEEIEFDLIHAHFTYHYGYAGKVLKKNHEKPLVITAHGDDVYAFPFKSNKWHEIIVNTLNCADSVITVSGRNKEVLINRLNIGNNKVLVIPNGFNSQLFFPADKTEARRLLKLPQDKKLILNVASLTPLKGHSYLIDAIKKIKEMRNNIMIVIIGEGALRKTLQKRIEQYNLEDCVKLVGAKPHKEIPLWMNAADIFVLPSLSEGNPTVMFEALGVGLPFVGTAVGGVPEVITSEDYGLLCPPADPECLAEKILIALEKEWDREKIREYAEQFTWDNIAKKILKVYRNVLQREGSL